MSKYKMVNLTVHGWYCMATSFVVLVLDCQSKLEFLTRSGALSTNLNVKAFLRNIIRLSFKER